ncbi:MAG TPA: TonB-dependent receptor [Candidatus Baltobacteraceae bacterium]|nr:TonB-dependent receptor [Candidatus Baltobacteraceae bacterium]
MTGTIRRPFFTAIILLATMLGQETWALAGTTGGLSGTVSSAATGAPIAGANVVASGASQVARTTTDAAGRFNFLSLAPDTYTVSVSKDGYDPVSEGGATVFADSVQTLAIVMQPALKEIARVTSSAAGNLVKSGTTSDVYTVNAATQQRVAAVGGGGGLNSAYSAIATIPGAYVAGNQGGYYQTVHIRGGDFDQVGYEFDGVPINRSFDNYPSGSASSLGQAEVQVYTGAAPSNSESQGLAGFINQVIKSGTYPGYANADLGIGAPAFYHHASVEAGGATPDRLFSYYAGVGGYNQSPRYVDNYNGSPAYDYLGIPLTATPEASDPNVNLWQQAPFNYLEPATLSVRDVVVNVHFALPHKHDGGRDDVQVLWDSEAILNGFYQSLDDATLGNTSTAYGQPYWVDGYAYNCPGNIGTTMSAAQANASASCVSPYYYPSGPTPRYANIPGFADSCPSENTVGAPCSFVPANERDGSENDQEILKVQYQKNFGENAYLRVYGYTYYSDWLLNGPNLTYAALVGPGLGDTAPDYELTSHTRGVSATFADQINDANLISLQGSYTTSNAIRDNNEQMLNFALQPYGYVAVNAADPYSGYCYSGAGGTAVSCNPTLGAPPAQFATWSQIASSTVPALPTTCADPNVASTACTYLSAENGEYGYYNQVTPQFTALSLTDQFRPTDKLLFNIGVRENEYRFVGQNTNEGPARQFWYNAYNLDTCVSNGVTTDVSALGVAPGDCAAAGQAQASLNNDVNGSTQTFDSFEPRFAFTYTQNPYTVWRGSIGKYSQPPDTATEQYNTLQLDEPFTVLGPVFLPFGRTSPSYPIYPPTSTNADLSLEHTFKGTDISFKLTPFFRHTENQLQNFFLNQAEGFISELNVGAQSSRGVEFQLQKGDFSRNGLSGLLSFAYTYSTIKYQTLGNGQTIITPLNAGIAQYNAYTSACANPANAGKTQYGQAVCGSTMSGVAAAPCYTAAGAPDPACAAGDYGNPYWDAPLQPLINPNQSFPTYDIFPAGIGTSASAFGAPYVATIVLNYKHDKWAVTPSLQFQAGTRYGAPNTTPGLAPDECAGVFGTGADPRYPYGNPSTGTVDYSTCDTGDNITIPDPYTHQFDPLGSFIQPSQMMLNLQLSYDLSPRVTVIADLTNIVNACFGGSKEAWTSPNGNFCSYGVVGDGLVAPIVPAGGNTYNPGDTVQPFLQYPYEPSLGPFDISGLNTTTKQPFQIYVEALLKL